MEIQTPKYLDSSPRVRVSQAISTWRQGFVTLSQILIQSLVCRDDWLAVLQHKQPPSLFVVVMVASFVHVSL